MTDLDRLDALAAAATPEKPKRVRREYNRGWAAGSANALEACNPIIERLTVERDAAVRERGELREAAGAFLDEFEAASAGDIPLDGHYQRQALARLRTALHREDGA